MHLFQVGNEQFAPLASLSTFRTNLIEALSSFVGRDEELVELGRLLGEHRLVTLTGVRGVGKTRLAVRAALMHRELFPDGAWMVELGRLNEPGGTTAEFMGALGVVAQHGQAEMDRVVEFLADRRSLIILDNCEHLLDEAADVVERLLGSCSRLAVLATSRESLSIPGEHALRVSSLSVSSTHGLGSAVQLFVERVREERSDFELADADRDAVELVCARLDGLPLAIELAAARAQTLGVAAVAARLDERFRLLTGGRRGRVERHKTLRATVEWSFGLLGPRERSVFACLSVFAGSFDFDAALAVVGDDADDYEVVDTVASLVAKSMLVVEERRGVGTRYRMLETLRAFGQEQLDAHDDLISVRTRHLGHYRRRARATAIATWDHDAARAGLRMLEDVANYRAAYISALATGRLDDAVVIASNLFMPGAERNWREPADWLRAVLDEPDAAASPYWSWALAVLATHTVHMANDPVEAERLARRSVADRVDDVADAPVAYSAEYALCLALLAQGRLDEAVETAREFAVCARERNSIPDLVGGLFMQAWTAVFAGDYPEALASTSDFAREVGNSPASHAAWFLHLVEGVVAAPTNPRRALELLDRARQDAVDGGSQFLEHTSESVALGLRIDHAPLTEAAADTHRVIAGLWELRNIYNLCGKGSDVVALCTLANRFDDAALLDGWLDAQPGKPPPQPAEATRYHHALVDISTHLGAQQTARRAAGASWSLATAVEFMLTTLRSLSDTANPTSPGMPPQPGRI